MDRARRIAQFWNWLPAFRAVAESEHLPTAARSLGSSAPGLSRMIRLLENDLGIELFDRLPKRILLNDAGRLFLEHVRDAMRRVDDGLQALSDATYRGAIKICVSNPHLATGVLNTSFELLKTYPQLEVELVSWAPRRACEGLLAGEIDIALFEDFPVAEPLSVESFGPCRYRVFANPNHPLVGQSPVSLAACLQYAFVAPSHDPTDSDTEGDGARWSDGWPLNLRRHTPLRVDALDLAITSCVSTELLVFLPEVVGETDERLRSVAVDLLAERQLFMAHRRLLGVDDRVSVVARALRSNMGEEGTR
jgi:DNA-binding transcriptional LysR family regulator